jgi:hypothetical protein
VGVVAEEVRGVGVEAVGVLRKGGAAVGVE